MVPGHRHLESRDRLCNVIITGVPELEDGDLDGAASDDDKVKQILTTIGVDAVQPQSSKRMGQAVDGKKRPMLVKVASKKERDLIVSNAKALKNASDDYKEVYLRKDVHPSVRREWKRLRDRVKEEQDKPCNAGAVIQLDFKTRTIRRNNVVIDHWKPKYFQ